MAKRHDLYLQRCSRPEQSDHRQPDQAANISHQPRASPDSTSLASRIEFPTMTPVASIATWVQPLSASHSDKAMRLAVVVSRVRTSATRSILIAGEPGLAAGHALHTGMRHRFMPRI